MINWWNGLELIQQIFAIFAIPATIILAIQTILLLFGLGHEQDAGGFHDAGGAHDGGMQDGSTFDAGHTDHPDSIHDIHDATSHEDGHAVHDSGLRLITVRGLVAFFAVGGWAGIAMIDLDMSPAIASFIALVAGFAALLIIAWIFKLFLGLQSSGNLDINNAIGHVGEVYLRIPGNLRGTGKVTLVLQERSIEIDAMTEQPEDISTGQQVEVIGRRGDRIIVRSIPKT